MELNVPKAKAIKLLNDRVNDLYADFNEAAWKSRTAEDVKAIFGDFDKRYIEIKNFRFSGRILSDGWGRQEYIAQADKLLRSYIAFIEDHVADEVKGVSEAHFKAQFDELVKKYYKIQAIADSCHKDNVKLVEAYNVIRRLSISVPFQSVKLLRAAIF